MPTTGCLVHETTERTSAGSGATGAVSLTAVKDIESLKRRIASRELVLTGSLLRIGIYAFTHPGEMAFLTSRNLAIATDTSQASITRFVHALGLRKFSELRRLFQNELGKGASRRRNLASAKGKW